MSRVKLTFLPSALREINRINSPRNSSLAIRLPCHYSEHLNERFYSFSEIIFSSAMMVQIPHHVSIFVGETLESIILLAFGMIMI
jgi:hypothetical protein